MIIGNKCDLESSRIISTERGELVSSVKNTVWLGYPVTELLTRLYYRTVVSLVSTHGCLNINAILACMGAYPGYNVYIQAATVVP